MIRAGNGAPVPLSTAEFKKDLLQACRFSFCIHRTINWAISARRPFPDCQILAAKINYKSAYQRGHMNAETALQTCIQLPYENKAVLTLCNTFGRAPCRCCLPSRLTVYGWRHKRIQSVVLWEAIQCGRCSLLGLASQYQWTHLSPPSPFPPTDSNAFRDISPSQRDQLLADFTAAAITHERGVRGGTHNDESRSWWCWREYCLFVGCTDFYLDSLSKQGQILMLWAFAMAVRSGRFSDKKFGTLVEGTVRGAISNVVQAFWAARQ